jgi:RNA polymerase sigma-70 factor (ECF subfamily)
MIGTKKHPSLHDEKIPSPIAPALSESAIAERHQAVCDGAVKHLQDLRLFARSLAGNRSQADDLVQSAIMRALDAAQQFTPGTNIKAWMFTILRNFFYNQWRSPASRQIQLDDSLDYMQTVAAGQHASLEVCDFRRAFAQLPAPQREALLLVAVSGLDYDAAAAVCGCASGTVKSRVSRGRASLRALMDGGSLSMRRNEVVAISGMDLVAALQGSGSALNRRVGPRAQMPAFGRSAAMELVACFGDAVPAQPLVGRF